MADPPHTPEPPTTGPATDILAQLKQYLKYALYAGLVLALWGLMGFSFWVLLMLVAGGLIISGSQRSRLDLRLQTWRSKNPEMKRLATVPLVGPLVKMTVVEMVGFGLLGFTLFVAGVNVLLTLTGSEPLIGLFATVVVITLISYRWFDTVLALVLIGLVVAATLATLATEKLISNDWFTDLIGNMVDRIPGIFWIFGILVISIILIGLIKWLISLKPLSRLVLITVVALIGFELVATFGYYDYDGKSTSDQCISADTAYKDYQVCEKDGPDTPIALARLVAILVATGGALYFRSRELEHEEIPDSDESDNDSEGEDPTDEHEVEDNHALLVCLFERDQKQRVVRADQKGFLAPTKLYVLGKHPELVGQLEDSSFLEQYLEFRREQALLKLRLENQRQNLFTANNKQFLVKPLKKIFEPRGKDFIDEIGLTPADLPETPKRKPPPA